ncbi:hypothetical protein D3C84_1066660 [compost metagenome]
MPTRKCRKSVPQVALVILKAYTQGDARLKSPPITQGLRPGVDQLFRYLCLVHPETHTIGFRQ